MRGALKVLVCAAVAATGCSKTPESTARPAPEIRYDGATTISNKLLPEVIPAFRARSGVTVHVDRSGAGKGLKAALAGQVDVAGVSRSLKPEELAAKPYFQIIGYDALGIWVNDQNPVKSLTKAQLRGIYSGKVTSWREIGGKPLPIVACTERVLSERATLDAVRMLILDGGDFGRVKELEDPADCLKAVQSDPSVITAATMTYAVPGVRAVAVEGLEPTPANVRGSRYLLTRPLLLVTKEPPTGATRELFDFMLSPEGQAIVARAGFVPAR
jgi:phosphate transport system substrate-binding protein